jgi:pyruvate/2-oxoglutarate/acetoin dehydrogenase E1 component
MTYLQALNQALQEAIQSDPTVYLLGEDVRDPYGGAFKVSRGISTKFPDRVISTPISEAAIVGIAGGMALRGLRPVVEIMFGDFITLAFDQIVNHIGKYKSMYSGQVEVPLVIRTPMGGGRGYGPTHSQSLEKFLFGVPGIKVVCPSLFHDPGAMIKAAVADNAPVVFLEHKLLYPAQLAAADKPPVRARLVGDPDYPVAIVRNFDEGRPDVTVIAYGGASRGLTEMLTNLASEEVRISCVLPSLLNRIDCELIGPEVLAAASGVLVWEESTAGFDWGAEVVSRLYEYLGSKLGHVRRVASLPTAIPAARHLEKHVLANEEKVEEAILEIIAEVTT